MKLSKQSVLIVVALFCFGVLTPLFLHAEEKIAEMVTASNKQSEASPHIPAADFVESTAGQLFQSGDYVRALEALDGLLKQYPDDSLIIRYKAITLNRLGRYDEAIAIFEKLVDADPVHVPTRFFLGRAYEAAGKKDAATKEWQWIVQLKEKTAYHYWAEKSLSRIENGDEVIVKRELPKWYIVGQYGYEYDTNVTLKPDDKSISAPGDQNAGRHQFDLSFRYRAHVDRDEVIDFFYATRQSLNDDGLNEFNFHSQEFGVGYKKKVQMGNKDVVLGARYDLIAGFLDGHTFSLRNRFEISADTRLTPYTRTVAYSRSSFANFGNDGFAPGRLSRDGFYQDFGLTHYFYLQDFRRFVFVRNEVNLVSARGDNYDEVGVTGRVGVHSPVAGRLEADVSSGVNLGFYPHFSSTTARDAARRRDVNWDVYTALTYRLTAGLGLRAFYRYINSWNQNNIYDYSRHIAGAQVIYSWFK